MSKDIQVDNIINSLKRGELVCITSRPGLGKTTLVIDIVNNICEHNNKIIFISLENSQEQLRKKIKNKNIEIITEKLSIIDIEYICKKIYLTNQELSLVVIDYLQLITKSQDQEIIGKLKSLARELNITIILTSQLPKYKDLKPTIYDVENISNSLIHNSDKIVILYKDNNLIKLEIIKKL